MKEKMQFQFYKRISIRSKLYVVFLFLVFMIGVSGGAGIFFINQIHNILHNSGDLSPALQQAMESGVTRAEFFIGILVVLGLLIGTIASFSITHSITSPLLNLIRFSEVFTENNFSMEDMKVQSQDETAQLTEGMNQMKNRLRQVFEEMEKSKVELNQTLNQVQEAKKRDQAILEGLQQAMVIIKKIGQGDFTKQLNIQSKGVVAELASIMNQFIDQLSQMIFQIKGGSAVIASSSQEMATGMQALSKHIAQQANSLKDTAVSMEEVNMIVQSNANNSRDANDISRKTKNIVEEGRNQLLKSVENTIIANKKAVSSLQKTNKEVVEAMSEIASRSEKISGITTLMNDIAFQTNLLALNAAVEAARAGEQGKGFAVVASEVRNLALHSSKASKQINKLIRNNLERIIKGRQLVDLSDQSLNEMRLSIEDTLNNLKEQSGKNLDEILEAVKRVSAAVESISAASSEQATGIFQINQAVNEMGQITQSNALMVKESATASKTMAQEGANLMKQVAIFKINVDPPFPEDSDIPQEEEQEPQKGGEDLSSY